MNQNSLFLILAAPACAWVSGMGVFKTLLVMAIMHRWVPNGDFTGPLAALSNDTVFYGIAALAAIEIIVDYIPRWDIHWDRWNAHFRIAVAAVLVWLVLYDQTIDSRVMMAVVGAALAITSFTAKTSARKAAIRGNTANIMVPITSTTENCMIAATLLPLTRLPAMTLLMVGFMLMGAMLVIYVVRREARETFRWVFNFHWTPAVNESEEEATPLEPAGK